MNAFVLALAAVLFSTPLLAFRLDPMVVEFSPSGSGSSHVFRVENDGQERIAVEIKVTTRSQGVDGKEVRDPSEHFSVFPSQLSLGPNDSRNIRVTYKGGAGLKSESAYRLIATQLPVDFKGEKKQAQLNFLFQYVASVYVKPAQAYPKLEVQKVEAAGDRKVKVLLANVGTAHRLLRGVRLKLKSAGGEEIRLREESYKEWPGENILAGSSREYVLETEKDLPKKAKFSAEVIIEAQP